MTPTQFIKRYSGHDVWNIGLVAQTADDIVRNGIIAPVRWLPRSPLWSFFADPFVLVEDDGSYALFAERMNYRAGKGSIWSGRLESERDGAWAELRPIIDAESHMSFPFAFRHEGRSHLLCETWEAGGASLYVRGDDGSWSFKALQRPGNRTVVDAALHHDGARWWLFCMHPGLRPLEQLYLYSSESPFGPWRAHPANPIRRDRSTSRPAGPLFETAGGLIRPAQDCSTTYGGALVLNRVVELTPTTYREETIRRITPIEPYGQGLHAICPAGRHTLIDGKSWRFHPLDPVRKIFSGRRSLERRARLRAQWPK